MSSRDEASIQLGAHSATAGARFTVRAPDATAVHVCLFDAADNETSRHGLTPQTNGLFVGLIPDISVGVRYGLRADGPWDPDNGHRFDPSKLLVDPLATRIDRPFTYDSRLGEFGFDTARLVPKAILEDAKVPVSNSHVSFKPGGLIYEIPVRAFTMLHPDIPENIRGTLAALCHPAIIAHLKSLHVSAIELMPIAAWIDERHLPPLELTNGWGYNPITLLALDPRLAPGGIDDLRHLTTTMHDNGISVILDVVYNHTGESDLLGPTLSLRGLGNRTYYSHDATNPGKLINDTGCGNTLACHRPEVRELVLASMRHLVTQGGVDGFRFDLAPVLGRDPAGFSARAEMLEAIPADPILENTILIAEPWDIGPGGYQLGQFPPRWLEWNDRARDDMRLFWRGEPGKTGDLATRLAGSSDIFGHDGAIKTRSVNFIAAHDGFPLGDLVTYADKHNEANGEYNRDGHNENFSWNNGVEGPTDDKTILARREADARAMIATLFASRGTLLLTAGDEFGHTQMGNNNAYAQDNEITWRNWQSLNEPRLAFTQAWATLRAELPHLSSQKFLQPARGSDVANQVAWYTLDGQPLEGDKWNDHDLAGLMMVLGAPGNRLILAINRSHLAIEINIPAPTGRWTLVSPDKLFGSQIVGRNVILFQETA